MKETYDLRKNTFTNKMSKPWGFIPWNIIKITQHNKR